MEGRNCSRSVKLHKLSVELTFRCGFAVKVDLLVIPVLAAVLLTGFFDKYLLAFIAITLHESAHILAAVLSGIRVYSVCIYPVGLSAAMDEGGSSLASQILVLTCGPALNIITGLLLAVMNTYYFAETDNMRFFISANISLALFNLLPLLPLDGGRMLLLAAASKKGFTTAGRWVFRLSLLLAALLICMGLVQLYYTRTNFSLLFIGFYALFSARLERTEAAMMNIKNIIYRRSRLMRKGIYPARDLVVMKSTLLGDTLKHMDFDRFHIIHVLDDELRLAGVFTEQEILEELLGSKGDLSYEDFIGIKAGRGEKLP